MPLRREEHKASNRYEISEMTAKEHEPLSVTAEEPDFYGMNTTEICSLTPGNSKSKLN